MWLILEVISIGDAEPIEGFFKTKEDALKRRKELLQEESCDGNLYVSDIGKKINVKIELVKD